MRPVTSPIRSAARCGSRARATRGRPGSGPAPQG
jgi:hypothetical protein